MAEAGPSRAILRPAFLPSAPGVRRRKARAQTPPAPFHKAAAKAAAPAAARNRRRFTLFLPHWLGLPLPAPRRGEESPPECVIPRAAAPASRPERAPWSIFVI